VELKEWLARCGLVAVLRGIRPEEAEPIGAALDEAGFAIMEVPLNSPDPYASIERLASRFSGTMLVGAGTVRRRQEVRDVAAAGGRVIVTPHAALEVVAAAKETGLFVIPGFFTTTEAFAALELGADALKLFPAEAASPEMLRALRAVFPPDTMVLPVGGIGVGALAAWVKAGAAGFGIGSSLYRPGDTPPVVGARARDLVAALRTARGT